MEEDERKSWKGIPLSLVQPHGGGRGWVVMRFG